MNIVVVGAGYVGLVAAACLAEAGHSIWCVDEDQEKIRDLQSGVMPIYEPGLQEMVSSNIQAGRLSFTTSLRPSLEQALICIIAVGTPPGDGGAADLTQVHSVARAIGQVLDHYLIIVTKSTVPVGTAGSIRDIISRQLADRNKGDIEFHVVSNPEFLKEGAALADFLRPDRVIIGTEDSGAADIMRQLYRPFLSDPQDMLVMDTRSAELAKYAANAMLATRISFMNEMAQLCDKVGADVLSLRQVLGTDSRIGMAFLWAGAGYGGSCFPKDVQQLIRMGQENGVDMEIAQAVESVNQRQKSYLADMIRQYYDNSLQGRTFAVWGLAFKPQTDDMRQAPAVAVIDALVKDGAAIRAYDPEAMPQARQVLAGCADAIRYADDMMAALKGADALILITEWQQFCRPDFREMKRRLRRPVIFDGRNQYDPDALHALGFEYYCIGRGRYV